jgi:hypothetical protein
MCDVLLPPRGGAVVEALRYKPEGRGIDSRWCQNFLLTSFRSHYGPGVDSASNRNEYQECFLGVKAAGAQGWQPYHLNVLIVLKSGSLNLLEPSGPVKACKGVALPFLLLPPGVNPITVKYIIYHIVSYHIIILYHIISYILDKPPYRSVFSRNSDASRSSLMMADYGRNM